MMRKMKRKIKGCSWKCLVCGKQCGGVEGHGGKHQCPVHYDFTVINKEEKEKFEPLKGKIGFVAFPDWEWRYNPGMTDKWTERLFKFKNIKSAIKWYKKYRNFPASFKHNEPELFEELNKHFEKLTGEKWFHWRNPDEFCMQLYQEWLFDKAFEDVIKEGE